MSARVYLTCPKSKYKLVIDEIGKILLNQPDKALDNNLGLAETKLRESLDII